MPDPIDALIADATGRALAKHRAAIEALEEGGHSSSCANGQVFAGLSCYCHMASFAWVRLNPVDCAAPTVQSTKPMTFNPNGKMMMAPADTPRWYDGEPKKPPRGMFRSGDARTALWLIAVVVSAPGVQVDYV